MIQFSGPGRFNWVESTGPEAGKAHDNAGLIRASASIDDDAANALLAGSGHKLAEIRAAADKPWVKGKPLAVKGFALKGSARIYAASSTRVTSPNVVGMIEGSDPALKDQYVVLSATWTIWAWTRPRRATPRTRTASTTARWTMRRAPPPCWKWRA
jgi:hypothetical protein